MYAMAWSAMKQCGNYIGLISEFTAMTPAQAGFDAEKLAAAVDFFERHESSWPRDIGDSKILPGLNEREPPPWNEIIGPLKNRGGPTGLLLKGGARVTSWGDIDYVDLTFSVAKSYLAVLTGLAVGDGLINSLDDRVGDQLDVAEFSSEHNSQITWRHLLTQSSEWQGTLFSKPDIVDHNRVVGDGDSGAEKGQQRELQTPGRFYEYNDVRVNVLSLALLHVFGRELPSVLKERIMDPIGASNTWQWHPYRNAKVQVNGKAMMSVPGGTHWGGGIWISSVDHAKFGLLIANDGQYQGERILPAGWVAQMFAPSAVKADYGLLWWLNTNGVGFPGLPHTSVMAVGAGSNIIWLEPTLDLLLVARWIDADARDEACRKILAAMA